MGKCSVCVLLDLFVPLNVYMEVTNASTLHSILLLESRTQWPRVLRRWSAAVR
jgi:hypothetical protein